MNEGRLERRTARVRRALGFGLAIGAALTIAVFGGGQGTGRDADGEGHAEMAAQMHLVLGNRSVGELFPVR